MSKIINNLVKKILIELERELKSEPNFAPSPATSESIIKVCGEFKNMFNFAVPDEYISILKITNGLIFNGLTMWPTNKHWIFEESLVGANLNLKRYFSDKYIYFGTRDDELYVYSISEKKYLAIEYAGESAWENFADAGSMFEFMLLRGLGEI